MHATSVAFKRAGYPQAKNPPATLRALHEMQPKFDNDLFPPDTPIEGGFVTLRGLSLHTCAEISSWARKRILFGLSKERETHARLVEATSVADFPTDPAAVALSGGCVQDEGGRSLKLVRNMRPITWEDR